LRGSPSGSTAGRLGRSDQPDPPLLQLAASVTDNEPEAPFPWPLPSSPRSLHRRQPL